MSNMIDIGSCGDQHLPALEQIQRGYVELYRATESKRQTMRKKVWDAAPCEDNEPLIHFVSMRGKEYRKDLPVRFFLVGRATNDWGTFSSPDIESFVQKSMSKINSTDGFSWIVEKSENERKGMRNGTNYYLNGSAFWRTARRVHAGLSGEQAPRWVEYITWSDLYKIAPRSGNPGSRLCQAQLSACAKILQGEIELYQPTHILFLTGWEWWFEDFKHIFPDVTQVGQPGDYVRGAGTYQGAKVVVAVHPQGKPETEIVKEVLGQFERL